MVFFTRDRCHLCDVARPVVVSACEEAGAAWAEVDVDSEASHLSGVHDRWTDLVPVVTVDGHHVAHYRMDPDELARALVVPEER